MSSSPGSSPTSSPPLLPPHYLVKPPGGQEEDVPAEFYPSHLYVPALPPPSSPAPPPAPPVCIPSPYTDGVKDFTPHLAPNVIPHAAEFNHGPLAFYPVSDAQGAGPPLSPSLFWPAPAMALHCPTPLLYEGQTQTHTHSTWAETKTHTHTRNSSFLAQQKLYEKQLEVGVDDEGVNSSSSSSSSSLSSSSSGPLVNSDLHYCVVCHDYASGYHYGVWSCEGCKAFFKRSIQGHNDYICPATNQCTIDKNRRKSCQACRLRKCYDVGMVKYGIRRERCGYRGPRHRRVPTGAVARVCGRGQHQLQQQVGAQTSVCVPRVAVLQQAGAWRRLEPGHLVHCILEAEPPLTYLKRQLDKPYTESSVMSSLTHLADKELVLMISWAKKIPGFVELSLSHQVHLLECCWLEVLMLGLMWRSVDHPGKLIFSPDLKLNRDEWSCVEGIMEIFDVLLAGSSRFRELKLQKEEYVCLKALILLNSNLTSPESEEDGESRTKLFRLLDSVTDALVWAISKTGLSKQQQSARLAHLLMLLSHIRQLSNKGMEHLSSMKRKNVVLLYDLLLEMLDANITHSSHTNPAYLPAGPTHNPAHLPAGSAHDPAQLPTSPAIQLQSPAGRLLEQEPEIHNINQE